MLCRLTIAVVLTLTFLTSSPASAQFGTPEPGSQLERDDTGRTPRQPRTSVDEEPAQPAQQAPPPPRSVDEPTQRQSEPAAPQSRSIASSRVRSHVDVDRPMVALTLDDGYRPDPRILELIESYGIHGTAFIVGEVAESNPGLINELARLGWLVCSHTYSHALLPSLSPGAINREIVRGVEAVERVVGYRCPYFRAPFGAVNGAVVAEADALGLEIIGWEASLSDSAPKGTDPDLQLSIAQTDIRPGSIVLGHFGGTNSYEVLSRLLAWLGDEGYGVGSVTELIDGNIPPLGELGTAQVAVDDPGVQQVAAADEALASTVGLPIADNTVVYLSVAALLFQLRPRRRERRLRRATRAESWRGELNRLAADLGETVPEWERPDPSEPAALPGTARVTSAAASATDGWT